MLAPFFRRVRSTPRILRTLVLVVAAFYVYYYYLPAPRRTKKCKIEVTVGPGGVGVLDLAGCGFRELPVAALDLLESGRVEALFLSNNLLGRIPRELAGIESITRLGLKGNDILGPLDCSALPPNLEHLILTNNKITRIPADCSEKLKRVKKLMLARNRIGFWDPELELPSMELVRLGDNRLERPPKGLLDAAKAPRLKWLGLGSNPCCLVVTPSPQGRLPRRTLGEFCGSKGTYGGVLVGSGASGSAFRCGDIVVKRFNGHSSDGDAGYEREVSARVPRVAGLLTPLAHIDDGEHGSLVLPYFDGRAAALPPDIFAVSRDQYPGDGPRLKASDLLNITQTLGLAVRELHGAGIAHGDIYAHNVLLSADGKSAVLIDYGAATLTDSMTSGDRDRMETMDCEAFKVMAGEFADHLVDYEDGPAKEVVELIRRVDPCAGVEEGG
jgi:tRNA A-37 threonylcarbamoyl transferase component Bud32